MRQRERERVREKEIIEFNLIFIIAKYVPTSFYWKVFVSISDEISYTYIYISLYNDFFLNTSSN